MALLDFPKLASGFYEFIKGKMDWHEPLNKNFNEVDSRFANMAKEKVSYTDVIGGRNYVQLARLESAAAYYYSCN